MTPTLAGLLLAGGALPYLLPRQRLAPMTGATLWLSVLLLRAMLVLLAALVAVLYVPATALFELTTHWCIHAVVPFVATHLGFSGHRVGDAATFLPGLILGVSLIWALFGFWRAGRKVRGLVRRNSLGRGPKESVIVGGREVVVAAAGIRDARVIVSTGALTQLDEEELSAGLEHERGHIDRRHPYLIVAANLAFVVARPLPGSRDALGRLRFYLERDADEYAVSRTRNPIALASAICKAASGAPAPSPALATLAGNGVALRLRLLLDRAAARPSAWADGAARALAISLAALVLLAGAAMPTLAQAGVTSMATPSAPSCD